MLLSILILTGVAAFYALYLHLGRTRRLMGLPPGPTPLPVIGNLHQIGLEPHKSFVNLGKKYGGILSVDFGSFRSVVVNDLKLLKQSLNDAKFSGRPKFRISLERCGKDLKHARGLIFGELQHWTEQRRFVTKNLRGFGLGQSSMEGIIQEEVREVIETLRTTTGTPITTRGLFNIAVVNCLWRICTSVRMSHHDPKLQKLICGINDLSSAASPLAFFFPILTKLFPKLSGYNSMMRGVCDVAQFVGEEYEVHKSSMVFGEPRDLMDAMIQEVESTTDPNSSFFQAEGKASVIKSLEDLFLAGSDTTSNTLSWIFLFMAVFPEIQQKLYDEIYRIVGPSKTPELIHRQNMPYLECIWMETLRIVSLVPLSIMHCTTEDTQLGGYTIPKGTVLIPNLYAVMHDEGIWGDPDAFRPERFLMHDGTANKTHEAFVPFSCGKRICIGEKLARDEIFLFSTSLFQRFRVTLNPNSPLPSLKPRSTIVLSPDPHELILEERVDIP